MHCTFVKLAKQVKLELDNMSSRLKIYSKHTWVWREKVFNNEVLD